MGERPFKKKPLSMELTNENGWFLTPEGLDLCNNCYEDAIDMDLNEIGAPSLPEELGKGKVDIVKGGIILQVSKIRNVSAPKSNEDSKTAPRMLKLTLTDGKKSCNAIEMSKLEGLSIEKTMPGLKVKLVKDVPVSNGYLLLESGSLSVLGGYVEALAKKWQMKTEVWTREQEGVEGLPPAWIPFGSKIPGAEVVDRAFKTLQNQNSTSNKENTEFDSLRSDAIKEASKTGSQKVFGAGSKDIKEAEKPTRGKDRQRTENGFSKFEGLDGSERVKGGRKGKGRNRDDDTGTSQAKPSGKISLFDFLEDKLSVDQDSSKKSSSAEPQKDWNPSLKRSGFNTQERQDSSYPEKHKKFDQNFERENVSIRGRGRGGRANNNDRRHDYRLQENSIHHEFDTFEADHSYTSKRGSSTLDTRGQRGGDRGRGSRHGKGGGNDRAREDYSNHLDGLKSNGTKQTDESFRQPQRNARAVRPEREYPEKGSWLGERSQESAHDRPDQSRYSERGGRNGRSERGNRGSNSDKGQPSKDLRSGKSDKTKLANRAQYPELGSSLEKQIDSLHSNNHAEVSTRTVDYNGQGEKGKSTGGEGDRRKDKQGSETRSSGQAERLMNDRDFGEWNNSTYHNSQQTRAPQNYQQHNSQFQHMQQPYFQGQQPCQSNVQKQHPQQGNHLHHQIQQHLHAALQSLSISDKGSHNQQKSGEGSRGRADIVSVQTPDFSQPPPIKSDSNSATPQWSSNQANNLGHPNYTRGGGRGGGNSQGRSQWKQQMQAPAGPGLQPPNQQNNFHPSAHLLMQQQPTQTHSAHPPANVSPNYQVLKQHQALPDTQTLQWRDGDEGMAKYWEDGKYYPIKVTAISTTTAVVFYKDYGNFEEVLLQDLLPLPMSQSQNVGQPMRFIPATPGLPPAFPHA